MRKSPYDKRTETTRNRIMGSRTIYSPNQLYKSNEGGFHYYINNLGYLHIVKPRRVKLYEVFSHYEIVDYMLTKDDKLKESGCNGLFQDKKTCMEKIEAMMYGCAI